METLFRVVCSSLPPTPPIPHRFLSTRNPSVSALRTGPSPVSELAEEDVLQTFFKERQLNGDFISRLSDVFWQMEFTNFVDGDGVGDIDDTTTQQQAEEQQLPHRSLSTRNPSVSALRTGPSPVSEPAEEDVLQTFFKERQLNGDFISRLSDVFWQREFTNFVDGDGVGDIDDTTTQQQAEKQFCVHQEIMALEVVGKTV